MNERRQRERCVYCGGTELRWKDAGVIKRICLICGKDFVARREEDSHKFHEEMEKYR
jgi:hypothetical protein